MPALKRGLSAGLLETYMERFELKKEDIMEEKAAFDLLDVDGSGTITLEELKTYNAKFKGGFAEQELMEQFQEMDVDGNGGISFLEFLKVYVKGEYGREVHIGLEHIEHSVEDLERNRSRIKSTSGSLSPIREQSGREINAGGIEMKLSRKNTIGYYIGAARLFLKGGEGKPPVNSLTISALGEAINAAISVAVRMESDGIGKITKVRTAYPDMPNGRGCAQVIVDVERVLPA